MIVAVSVVVIFVGIGVGMSGVSEPVKVTQPVSDRPDVQQQGVAPKDMASSTKVVESDLLKPPGPSVLEICGDGVDNNGNGKIDEAPTPPRPGVDWSECDLTDMDLCGADLDCHNHPICD